MLDVMSSVSPSNMLAARRKATCYVMGMKPIEDVRRENLTVLIAQEGSQAAFARRIRKDKNQVNQWLGRGSARNISAEIAREVERSYKLPKGWLDQDRSKIDTPFTDIAKAAPASHSGRRDLNTIAGAVEVLRRYLAIADKPSEWISRPTLLVIALELVEEVGEPVTQTNVIDFTERLSRKLRDTGGGGDERGSIPRVGTETG